MPDDLSFENVHASYGASRVLQGVSLRSGEGSLPTLLGRNGAGKMTCVRVATGLLAVVAGTVRFFGKPINRRAPELPVADGIALRDQGSSILLVEQNPKLALEIANDAAVLNRGRLVIDALASGIPAISDEFHKHLGAF